MAQRVALYLRVSTVRQAEKDLSIPDQRRQATTYCTAKGWSVVAEFEEAGASATDDRRPVFQRMIGDACGPARPFDMVVVHSFSRFFRDAFQSEFYIRKLAKHGVKLVSVTQETGDDPHSQMIRQIMALFDEYQSKENGKHTLRGMEENARQGFWNGARAPFGYRIIEAERRGDKAKKHLDIHPSEADMVRRIFGLYRHGDGQCGPMGVKAIAVYLNERGLHQRNGGRFSLKTVHDILSRTAYVGRHVFNRSDSKTKQDKPEEEWITVKVPTIIAEADFAEVQALLHSRNPRRMPPRVVSGPTLLTGLAKCATCGGGMTIRTGKGGRYRYYTCSTCARVGKTACRGRSVPMDRLDELVMAQLTQRLFTKERISELLAKVIERTASSQDDREAQGKALNGELRDIDKRLERLYEALGSGAVEADDTFRNHLSGLKQRREDTLRQIAMISRRSQVPSALLSPCKIEAFAAAMAENLANGNIAFRKAYLRMFVGMVEVGDEEIRISGPTDALVLALESADDLSAGVVPSFVQDWRPGRDSNPPTYGLGMRIRQSLYAAKMA